MIVCVPTQPPCDVEVRGQLARVSLYYVGSGGQTQTVRRHLNLLSHLAGPSLAYF